ncbi:MAG TPA: hypothetical protein PLU22_02325 [Polyangiaceae bacterium]|nr:hypothetical protein [Polyangiaceae bacterium]
MKERSRSHRGPPLGWARRLRRRSLIALLLASGSAAAEAVSTQTCVDSHVRAQAQRLEGQLVAASQSLRTCAHEACPDVIQRDCVAWLEELQGEVPTVVFDASDRKGPLTEVTVTHEGRVIATSIDGAAVELDPGTYDFAFETADGRRRTIRALIRQGERNRVVAADFSRRDGPDGAWVLRVPPSAQLLGAVTLVATATSAAFGASALLRQADALDGCAPDCDEDSSELITTHAAIADVAGAVALVSGAVTVAVVARASGRERPRPPARVAPALGVSPASGFVAVRGSF